MNKKHLSFLSIIMIVGACTSLSHEEEFIKQTKNREKKSCPSRQQYIELNAEIVEKSNEALRSINEARQNLDKFEKDILTMQCKALQEISGYMEGDKESPLNNATKKQRTDMYAAKAKDKAQLQKVPGEMVAFNEKMTAVRKNLLST